MRISDWSSDVCSSDLEFDVLALAGLADDAFGFVLEVGDHLVEIDEFHIGKPGDRVLAGILGLGPVDPLRQRGADLHFELDDLQAPAVLVGIGPQFRRFGEPVAETVGERKGMFRWDYARWRSEEHPYEL